jgi:hypothetical protein
MGVMSVSYTTINGEIVSENRNGVPSDYIPDALGSTIALLSDTHQITDSWTYWPNGQVRTRTGTNVTPHTFCGTVGYHSDLIGNFTSVQARQLRPGLARWQTLDPWWPSRRAYACALPGPIRFSDLPRSCPLWEYIQGGECAGTVLAACEDACTAAGDAFVGCTKHGFTCQSQCQCLPAGPCKGFGKTVLCLGCIAACELLTHIASYCAETCRPVCD